MAIVKCPKCGKEISNKAEKCPNCGFNTKESNKLSILSMILGIVSLLLSFTNIGLYVAVLAFLTSDISIKKNERSKAMSITGFITSLLVVIIWLIRLYMPLF